MATDLVISHGQKVAGSQPGAVRGENPRRQQHGVAARKGPTLHVSRSSQPAPDATVINGRGAGQGAFDPPKGAEYTLVHVPLIRGESHQGTQHSSVVGDSGGSQMPQGKIKVGIDPVWGQVAGFPWKPLGQYQELLQVSGASSDPAPVYAGKFADTHGGGGYSSHGASVTPPGIRYDRTWGQLAQLYSLSILRGAYLALLCVCFFLHRSESVLGLLVLGQFAKAFKEVRQARRA